MTAALTMFGKALFDALKPDSKKKVVAYAAAIYLVTARAEAILHAFNAFFGGALCAIVGVGC